ncbi:hypothetical protein U9J35_01585 [Rossellomorea aquimaris]|nr:hypothetical protein [Rossellomorea aquimaris]WRP06888.1 hypothetical protein U9J35_01585 [Rossellomorea aquimaris]
MAKKKQVHGRKIEKIEPFRKYIDYNMNPPSLSKFNGEYVQSQLKNLKRRYDAIISTLEIKKDTRNHLLELLVRKETSTRGTYVRMMKKEYRTKEELESLYIATVEIEDIYNALPSIEREIRDLERMLSLVFPRNTVEIIEQNTKEEMK